MDPDARLGTAPAFGGSGSGTHIELTIEEVEKIGRATAALNERAQTARTELADAAGGGGFSSHPSAQALYDQHQAVVEVFDKTLAAMTTDIEDFGHTIVQAAHNHDQTDNDVLATMSLIAAKVDTQALRNAQEQARNQAGHRLRTPDTGLDGTREINEFDDENPHVKDPSIDGLRPDDGAPHHSPSTDAASSHGTNDRYVRDGNGPQ